jgi:hypothetical protein
MGRLSKDAERLLARADDPNLIPGVYIYCDRRCERCPFTSRCLNFQELQACEDARADLPWTGSLAQSFQVTLELLEAWCEREGVSFSEIMSQPDEPPEEEVRTSEALDADPLFELARGYGLAANKAIDAIREAPLAAAFVEEIRDAIDTIAWHAYAIAAKTHRALAHSGVERPPLEEHPLQNDWNGSAKVARLNVATSREAWEKMLEAGHAPPDSPIRRLVTLLDSIDAGLAARFPRAMEFVRPGFDEPDIAAGAPATLDAFDPRPCQAPRGVGYAHG